ncbi:hypothetical protein DPEC_G00350030 [Dallia pectoralis]|uniref:Uncharacterized protein n=1 Tax=Dallia pectoralis TaxID=75939 RepID=A0ACC2F1J4_DALPE|nr:hypothetical protein DPEC_G00350030 [Dallia pectoralis]
MIRLAWTARQKDVGQNVSQKMARKGTKEKVANPVSLSRPIVNIVPTFLSLCPELLCRSSEPESVKAGDINDELLLGHPTGYRHV